MSSQGEGYTNHSLKKWGNLPKGGWPTAPPPSLTP